MHAFYLSNGRPPRSRTTDGANGGPCQLPNREPQSNRHRISACTSPEQTQTTNLVALSVHGDVDFEDFPQEAQETDAGVNVKLDTKESMQVAPQDRGMVCSSAS